MLTIQKLLGNFVPRVHLFSERLICKFLSPFSSYCEEFSSNNTHLLFRLFQPEPPSRPSPSCSSRGKENGHFFTAFQSYQQRIANDIIASNRCGLPCLLDYSSNHHIFRSEDIWSYLGQVLAFLSFSFSWVICPDKFTATDFPNFTGPINCAVNLSRVSYRAKRCKIVAVNLSGQFCHENEKPINGQSLCLFWFKP